MFRKLVPARSNTGLDIRLRKNESNFLLAEKVPSPTSDEELRAVTHIEKGTQEQLSRQKRHARNERDP